MNYPLISEYIEAIKSAEDNFKELTYLRPLLDDDGQPIMTSGNFAVVFKMKDIKTGKFHALKCFTKEQEGRGEAYHQIAEELKNVESPYIISIRYFDKELFVDTDQTTETEFPVLLMDWVEGTTLDKQLKYWASCLHNAEEKQNAGECLFCLYELESIAYNFCCLARWLLAQPFAHGDLKPDNILVKQNGNLVLVDYDGMYVHAMKGQKANELGSSNFRHPLRKEDDFNEHIDDFSIVNILLSLKAISLNPSLFIQYVTGDKLLFEEKDYLAINKCKIIPLLNDYLNERELATLLGAFYMFLHSNFLPNSLSSIIDIQQSDEFLFKKKSEKESKEIILYFYNNIEIDPFKLVYLISDLFGNKLRKYWLPGNLWDKCHVDAIWWDVDTYKSIHNWVKDFDAISYCVVGEFSKKSRPNVLKLSFLIHKKDYSYIVDYTYKILSEMNVLHYFLENVMKLIEIINIDNLYDFKREDLPF